MESAPGVQGCSTVSSKHKEVTDEGTVEAEFGLASGCRPSTRSFPEEPPLRHVEKDILIPQIMREKARELCSEKVQAFTKCCQDTGILMVVKCRVENAALKECITGYYTNPEFYEECKAEYLKQREDFRTKGIRQPQKKQRVPTSM